MKSPRSTTRTLSPDARNAQAAVEPAMPDPTMTMSVSMVEPVGSSTAWACVDAVPCGMVSLRFRPGSSQVATRLRPGQTRRSRRRTDVGRTCVRELRPLGGDPVCDDRGRLIG